MSGDHYFVTPEGFERVRHGDGIVCCVGRRGCGECTRCAGDCAICNPSIHDILAYAETMAIARRRAAQKCHSCGCPLDKTAKAWRAVSWKEYRCDECFKFARSTGQIGDLDLFEEF